jgi:hypothetical protein
MYLLYGLHCIYVIVIYYYMNLKVLSSEMDPAEIRLIR